MTNKDLDQLKSMSTTLHDLVSAIETNALFEQAQMSILINRLQAVEFFIVQASIGNENSRRIALENLEIVMKALKDRTT